MAFTITWTIASGGAGSTFRGNPVEAMTKALELMGQGFQNVTIFDENYRPYTPADFTEAFIGKKQ